MTHSPSTVVGGLATIRQRFSCQARLRVPDKLMVDGSLARFLLAYEHFRKSVSPAADWFGIIHDTSAVMTKDRSTTSVNGLPA
jgi:hypothetical protein